MVASSLAGFTVAGGLDPGFFLGRNKVPPFSVSLSVTDHGVALGHSRTRAMMSTLQGLVPQFLVPLSRLRTAVKYC